MTRSLPHEASKLPSANCVYKTLTARVEPEIPLLDVVRAWSRRPRGCSLMVLGRYEAGHTHQRALRAAASDEVLFPGAIYDKSVVAGAALSRVLLRTRPPGGGTNPSLVEALGAGNAVLAHDNPYNRWVAGEAGVSFRDDGECARWIERLLDEGASPLPRAPPIAGEGGRAG